MNTQTIHILYEDNDTLVINKPAGVIVHPDGKKDEPSVVDWIIEKYPEIRGVGEALMINGKEIDRPGIVHRLDRETSGALLIAKTKESFEFLKEQFQERIIKKTYRAFVYGYITEDTGVINEPIGRSPSDFRRFLSGRGARGELRDVETEYKVLARFEVPKEKGDKRQNQMRQISYVELYPKTGRTHQLRVHLQYLQHPILSDALYAPKRDQMLGFKRVALHAYSLSFKGILGTEHHIIAPLPSDFIEAEEKMKEFLA